MAWSLAGVTIHVDDNGLEEVFASEYAVQTPIDATGDTISWWAANSDRVRLTFVVAADTSGSGARATLRAAARANSDAELVGPEGSLGNYRIERLTLRRKMATNHILPVYEGQADLVAV